MHQGLSSGESIFIIGNTKDEMGGSEFYQTTGNTANGRVTNGRPECRQTKF